MDCSEEIVTLGSPAILNLRDDRLGEVSPPVGTLEISLREPSTAERLDAVEGSDVAGYLTKESDRLLQLRPRSLEAGTAIVLDAEVHVRDRDVNLVAGTFGSLQRQTVLLERLLDLALPHVRPGHDHVPHARIGRMIEQSSRLDHLLGKSLQLLIPPCEEIQQGQIVLKPEPYSEGDRLLVACLELQQSCLALSQRISRLTNRDQPVRDVFSSAGASHRIRANFQESAKALDAGAPEPDVARSLTSSFQCV